jgi:hypothetical protein
LFWELTLVKGMRMFCGTKLISSGLFPSPTLALAVVPSHLCLLADKKISENVDFKTL